MNNIDWLFKLKDSIPKFLERLKGSKIKGFFHYSLSGDLCGENIKWGLGNTVFAVKSYYTLALLDTLPTEEKIAMAEFIKSFKQKDGMIYDPLIKKKTFLKEKLSSFNNFFHQQVIRAETRQSVSALNLLGKKAGLPYKKIPDTKKGIEKYLVKLDWQKPWGAGSHFSHLIFFLKNSNLENKESLINFAINRVNKLQSTETGSWHIGYPSLRQKINGAMKVITALKVADRVDLQYPEKLIDLCLAARNNEHACDNFNITYVLKYANQLANFNYKYEQLKEFALDRLRIYKDYYYPEIGGFSFFKGKANDCYYGAKITKGLDEPDIHGTMMFLWGISIISQILGIEKELGFKELVP